MGSPSLPVSGKPLSSNVLNLFSHSPFRNNLKERFWLKSLTRCAFLFRGSSAGIVLLHSSLSSFVASTCLIRSGDGAIDSPDQSRQYFEQYDTSEVLEKVLQSTFYGLSSKIFIFGIFKACISNFAYTSLENTKNENFLTTSHQKVD